MIMNPKVRMAHNRMPPSTFQERSASYPLGVAKKKITRITKTMQSCFMILLINQVQI
nr:MAG TPA: hypothetical protein [Bacteriophage sp.]DAR83198.1 MAG TPA: hypothetical protein [Caudoviricetes sp.]DAT94820.1 MAG TPA: hypothetical protein [Caudoviricetes sp.]